jgi:hypothetical protein
MPLGCLLVSPANGQIRCSAEDVSLVPIPAESKCNKCVSRSLETQSIDAPTRASRNRR